MPPSDDTQLYLFRRRAGPAAGPAGPGQAPLGGATNPGERPAGTEDGMGVREGLPPANDSAANQLALFGARASRLAPAIRALELGLFSDAVHEVVALGNETALADVLVDLGQLALTAEDLEEVARLEQGPHLALLRRLAPDPLVRGAVRGIRATIAQGCEEVGSSATVAGRLAAEWWDLAGRPDEARRAAECTAEEPEHRVRALLWLAREHLGRLDVDGARECFRRALDGTGDLALQDVPDRSVRGLRDAALDYELAPDREWAVVLGAVQGLWSLSIPPERDASTAADCFRLAWIASREATTRGQKDVGARRAMKSLAPLLFDELLAAGKL